MNRPIWIAWGYGLTSVIVGVMLIRQSWPRAGVGGAVTEAGNGDESAHVAAGVSNVVELELEVGSTGVVWSLPAAPDTDGVPEGGGSMRIRMSGPAGVRLTSGWDPLPRNGSDLMRLDHPEIHAVADLLWEAGVPEYVLEGSLRGVYGHVQRFVSFKQMAARDVERADELERSLAEAEGPPLLNPPSLRWREEIWPRRSKEYVSYVRRDLETRLGITEPAVLDRLVALADQVVAREKELARVVERPGL